ncbi:MAG: type II toxin-antitoxin system RelE/ParE family toxin [Allosphingosinicella sp.]
MRLEIRATARADLARIFAFNVERSIDWAERVESRLLQRAVALTVSPHVGRPTAESGVRRLSVPDIQYVMDYRVAGNTVRILRIYSTREIQ